jgi:hypothetical protein
LFAGRLVHHQVDLRHNADGLQIDAEEAHGRVVPPEIVFALVLAVEVRDERGDLADRAWGRHTQGPALALVHHVDGALQDDVFRGDALVDQAFQCFGLDAGELRLDQGCIRRFSGDHAGADHFRSPRCAGY